MDILWLSIGVCLVVGFLFFVFARYWQAVLAAHARTIWRLSQRVRALEAMENPDFRQRIQLAAPLPLEHVCSFVFQLKDDFWQNTLHATAEEMAFIKRHGSFLGSVKIEQWRSHSVATVYEVLPHSPGGDWRIRSIDVYPTEGDGNPVTLWELPLGVNQQGSLELPPALELRMEDGRLQLCALYGRFGCEYHDDGQVVPLRENLYFDLPLDAARLAAFSKVEEPTAAGALLESRSKTPGALFEHSDEQRGLEWRVCIRDLQRRREPSGWKTWEAVGGGDAR
jgi:hypothetical protein